MFNPPRDAYREKRAEILRRAFVAQTALSIFAAVMIWQFGKLTESWFTESWFDAAGILMTLVSIPTVAGITIGRLRNFEEKGWRRAVPQWDFCGKWSYRAQIIRFRFGKSVDAEEQSQCTEVPQFKEVGTIVIKQTALTFSVQQGIGKYSRVGEVALAGWDSLSVAYDPHGRGFINTYQASITQPIELASVIEGIEHVSVRKRDHLGRPKTLFGTFSTTTLTLNQGERVAYTGSAEYTRVTT